MQLDKIYLVLNLERINVFRCDTIEFNFFQKIRIWEMIKIIMQSSFNIKLLGLIAMIPWKIISSILSNVYEMSYSI